MNNIRKLLCLAVMCVPVLINAQGIRFEDGLAWNQVLQKAQKENKYIFLDCYATWCGPCKWMDEKIYANDTAGQFFNEHFISVKLQMDTSKKDNDFTKSWYSAAAAIKSRYKIEVFPTYLFFSPNGAILHRDVGAKDLKDFIALGVDASDVNKQYYTLVDRYKKGQLDTSLMKYVARKAKDMGEEELAHKIANDYINILPVDALFTQDNIWLMYDYTKSSKDRGFQIFKDQVKRIGQSDNRFTEAVCKTFLLSIINKEEIKPYTTTKNGKPDWKRLKSNLKKYGSLGDEAFTTYKPGIIFKTEIEPALKLNSDWSKILPVIEKQNLGKTAEFVVGSTVVYYLNSFSIYKNNKDRKNFVAAASYYADSFPNFLNANTLNTWAWRLFQNSNDKEDLNKALAWSKRATELQSDSPDPNYIDTYANILYKLGLTNDAIALEEKAVEIAEAQAKKNNIPANPAFKDYLEKMKKRENTWLDK